MVFMTGATGSASQGLSLAVADAEQAARRLAAGPTAIGDGAGSTRRVVDLIETRAAVSANAAAFRVVEYTADTVVRLLDERV